MGFHSNRYERKRKTQLKMRKLYDDDCYFVTRKGSREESYYQRLYLSGKRKFSKQRTNRKIRGNRNEMMKKGCAYRREFDYWYTLF